MLKDLVEKSWLSEDDILQQVKFEFDKWFSYVTPIRKEFDKEDKLFRNEKKKKDKLWDFTYYSVYSALLARSYVNKPESQFESEMWNKDIVDKLNKIVEQDFNETDMEVMKYFRDSDKFKRWVWIIVKQGWDWVNKRWIFTKIDPRLWIPDPDWDYVSWKYAFSWFQADIYKKDLESIDWLEKINFDELSQNETSDWSKTVKRRDRQANNLSYTWTKNQYNPNYDIYYHFSYFNWVPAMVMTANDNTVILKVKLVKPITPDEVKDNSLIKLPFAFTYWIPDWTPFGMRVPTFTADAQKAKAVMNNLRMDKELAELYPMYLRNTNILPDSWDIEFGFNKIIDVTPLEWQSIKDWLLPIQKDFRSDNSFQIENSIDRNIASTTSIWKTTQGSLPSRRETATTNAIVQDNTDINLALAEKVEAWGEKQLLRLILRAYQEDFTNWDIKKLTYKTWYWLVTLKLKKNEFLTNWILKIKIVTKTEIEKTKKEEQLALWNAIGMIQTLPITESGKKFLYREYFESIWLDKEKAERIVDYTPDEIQAITNVELLNEWIMLEVRIDYDPMTHLSALKSARPWLNVELYKRWLLELYKIKGWQQAWWQMWQAEQWIANNMAAQSMANIANQQQSLNNNQ